MKMNDKTSMNQSSRIEYFDIAKGIGILCVIAGHMGNSKVNQFVYTFHMPLFFMISGYFISETMETKKYIYRKAKQLFYPYLTTCVVIMLCSVCRNLIKERAVLPDFQYWFLAALYGAGGQIETLHFFPPIGAIWYLPALFFSLCIVKVLKDRKEVVLLIILVAYVGWKTSTYIWLPLSIQAGMTATLFVFVGYYAKREHLLEMKTNRVWMLAMLTMWIICVIYGGKLYMVQNYYGNGLLDIIGAICAVYTILVFSKEISQYAMVNKILTFLGRNSLIILCFHLVELKMIPWAQIQGSVATVLDSQLLCLIVIFMLKLVWGIVWVLIVNHVKLLRRTMALEMR